MIRRGSLCLTLLLVAAAAQAQAIHHHVRSEETLQKISQKYFNTTRKWHWIYLQNKDVLSGPDAVRPGMILHFEIPDAPAAAVAPAKPEPVAAKPAPEPVAAKPAPEPVAAKPAPEPVPEESMTVITTAAPIPVVITPTTAAAEPAAAKPAPPVTATAPPAERAPERKPAEFKSVTYHFGSHELVGPEF